MGWSRDKDESTDEQKEVPTATHRRKFSRLSPKMAQAKAIIWPYVCRLCLRPLEKIGWSHDKDKLTDEQKDV